MLKHFMCLFVLIICLSGLSVEAARVYCYRDDAECSGRQDKFTDDIGTCCYLYRYYKIDESDVCTPCDLIDCYAQTTKCDTENPVQLPFYSADSSSRAAAGDRCCSLSNRGSWNDKITDTCTSCENTGPGDCFSGYNDCTGAYSSQSNIDECCGSNSLSYQDDDMCLSCDLIFCYSGTTECRLTHISSKTTMPHSGTPESIALVGSQCCSTGGGSWYDVKNPDTCTPCDIGPKHCFGGPTTCGGEFTAEPTIDSCCFDMGSGGGFYKDADNMCIPCDSIVCYSQTDKCDGGERTTIRRYYYSERVPQAIEQCCATEGASWVDPEHPSTCTPCRQEPTCHYDASCSDDKSAGASSSIGECCGDVSHGSFKENDVCISCESIMCYSSSTNCDSTDDTTIRQTSDQCCTAGGASWSDLRDGSCRQCTQEIFGDPHFFIPLLSKKVLCYSIQGYPGLVFNLIYNKHFVINALFKDSVGDTTEATWIGKLAVIPQANNKNESVLFDSVNQTVTITSYGSLKASMIEKINFTDTGSVIFIPHLGRQVGEHPTIHVIYSKPKASFDVTFFNDHLNVNWNLQDKELSESHGLMGQFMKAGVDIDEKKEILVYSDYHDPVPVKKDSVMTGDPNKLCWRAMNNGKQGEGLIHGSILDYVVTQLLDTNFKFKNM